MTSIRKLVMALAAAAAASVAAHANATPAEPAALPFVLKQVGPGVYAAIDGPERQSGSNAGFVIGDDAVLVVDSFYNPDSARALVAEIRRLTPKPIRYVVNTHYHVDHTAGDAVLREAGAVIIAHRNERAWVRTQNGHIFGDRLTPGLEQKIAALSLPDVTTRSRMSVWLGGRRVVIEPALGHTGGDLMVSIPDAHVLFCGDILWNHVSPNMIDGTVSDWTATLDSMQAAGDAAQTTFVPGHGDVADVKDVAALAGYFRDLAALVRKERAEGLSGDALVKAAMPAFSSEYAGWPAFAHFAPLQLGYMDEELAGTKRLPPRVPEGD